MKARFGILSNIHLSVFVTAMAVGLATQAASATTQGKCVQDLYQYQLKNTTTLQCTAKDVKNADVKRITPVGSPQESGLTQKKDDAGNLVFDIDGFPLYTCYQGSPIHFTANFEVDLGAQTRYDIGLYVAEGQATAKTGTCNQSPIFLENVVLPSKFNSVDSDSCGDISGPLPTTKVFNPFNPQYVHMDIQTTCKGDPITHKLKLPNCTSWKEKGSDTPCSNIDQAIPGAPSKCNCDDNFTVDVGVETPKLVVTKTPNPSQIPVSTPTTVTYQVQVQNTAVGTPVTLSSLTDNIYGDVTKDKNSGNTKIDSTTCTLATISAGSTYTCSFATANVTLGVKESITDLVCASASDSNVQTSCGTATVTEITPKPTATLVESVLGTVCAVVRYQVKVINNDSYEPIVLSALVDDVMGDITSVHGNVKATTCGLSTASGGPGAFPATLAIKDQSGDSYTCTYDAYTCPSALGTITDKVTATLVDADGSPPDSPTTGSATITVDNSGGGGANVTLKVTTP